MIFGNSFFLIGQGPYNNWLLDNTYVQTLVPIHATRRPYSIDQSLVAFYGAYDARSRVGLRTETFLPLVVEAAPPETITVDKWYSESLMLLTPAFMRSRYDYLFASYHPWETLDQVPTPPVVAETSFLPILGVG